MIERYADPPKDPKHHSINWQRCKSARRSDTISLRPPRGPCLRLSSVRLLVAVLPDPFLFHDLPSCSAKLQLIVKPTLRRQAGYPEQEVAKIPSEHISRKSKIAHGTLRGPCNPGERPPHSVIPLLKITLIDPVLVNRMENDRLWCINEPFASAQQAPAKLIVFSTNLASES